MTPAREASDEQMTMNVTRTETVPNTSIDDPYAKFEAEHQERDDLEGQPSREENENCRSPLAAIYCRQNK